ncbi:Transmembrane protein 136 [Papilio machaon]|uniref:Transmembrane protein 136 n=1 Tax=Papilio machaon TaxID=76193 RepID=A0A0N1IPB8_PAPMA|nr:TLC domain-containing protein 5 [Papilio machaon]KPJ13391.1 Transmembrane protein 136 [Papilio machaon]
MEAKSELSATSLTKLISFLLWTGLYLHLAVDSKRSPEWCSRAVTLLHGSVAACVGLAQCNVNQLTRCSLTMKLSWWQYALMFWSWGYFAFDFLWCLLYWSKSYTMLCHHLCSIIAINMYLSMENTGCTFACTIALLEVTNPLLQTRWFLRDGGYNESFLYYMVEITYLVLFLLLRGCIGTYLVYKILLSDVFGIPEKVITVSLYLVSLAFIYEIMGYVMYKYSNRIDEFKSIGGNEMGTKLSEQQEA